MHISTTQLTKQVKKTFDEMQKKQRNKGRDNGQRDSEEFLAAGFLTDASNTCSVNPVAGEIPPCHSSCDENSKHLELVHKQ